MKIDRYVATLDACVLAPMPIADTMLRLAEASFYTPKWSNGILQEVKRTLEKFGYTPQQSQRRLYAMQSAFPEALVLGYEDLVPVMKNDEKDRHVLAAAVRCEAHCIVTSNRKHFPAESLIPYDLECLTPDEFLVHQYHLETDAFISVLMDQARSLKQPFGDFVATLSKYAPDVAKNIRP